MEGGGRSVGCYRPESEGMLNAIEPGSPLPIHRHPNDDGAVIGDVVLSQESGNYGVDVSKNLWHMEEALELGRSLSVRGRLGSMRWKGFFSFSNHGDRELRKSAMLELRI